MKSTHPDQMQLFFEPQPPTQTDVQVNVVGRVTSATSNVVVVDFARTAVFSAQKSDDLQTEVEQVLLGQILDKAQRLNW